MFGQARLTHWIPQFTSTLLALLLAVSSSMNAIAVPSAKAPTAKNFLSSLKLPTYVWPAAKRQSAVVVGLHGGCLHGRAYNSFANALKAQGYTFVSMDMRGYGRWHHNNYGTERDTTFRYKESIADIEKVLRKIRQQYPRVPVYLLGESLGANLAVLVGSQNPQLVDGIIAVSFTSIKPFVSPRMAVNATQSIVNPTSRLNLRPYLKSRLSNNKSEAEAYLADPMSRDEQSFVEIVKSLTLNMKGKRAAKKLPSMMPVLVLVGGEDKLSSSKRSLNYFRDLPLQDVTLAKIPDLGHLLVETKSVDPRVFKTIKGWLDSRSKTAIATRPYRKPL